MVCIEYADGIIEEAKRIEQSDRSRNMQAEVIASHIDEAKKIIEEHLPEK